MAIGVTFVILAIVILAIWVFVEFKRFRHKTWAVLLILLILLSYFSFTSVIKGKDINLKTFNGIKEAGSIYFLWLGHAFGNMKTITTNVIDLNWTSNKSLENNS